MHESPRVVPGEPTTIREGMVLMLEPGAYAPGVGGVRLEWMYLVTATGNEVLSGFDARAVARARGAGMTTMVAPARRPGGRGCADRDAAREDAARAPARRRRRHRAALRRAPRRRR